MVPSWVLPPCGREPAPPSIRGRFFGQAVSRVERSSRAACAGGTHVHGDVNLLGQLAAMEACGRQTLGSERVKPGAQRAATRHIYRCHRPITSSTLAPRASFV